MHLLFWLYVAALVSGSASIAIAVFIRSQHRTPVVLLFSLFLGALFLIVLSMSLEQYAALLDPGAARGVTVVALVVMVVGAGGYMYAAPFFYHALVGVAVGRGLTALYLALASIFVPLSLTIFFLPTFRPTLIALNLLLFGTVGYGIVYIAVRYRRIGDRRLRRAVRVFLIVSAIFFPLMYVDSMLFYVPIAPWLARLDGTALPLFFLVLNSLAVRFAATYLNEPPYLTEGRISSHFRGRYGISEREAEIIRMLMDGKTSREVGEELFISPKTVENHVYNIYQKTHVRNRIELVNLIREHRGV